MKDPALVVRLRRRVADATVPERQLFVEEWVACSGKQSPDTKARFAILLEAKAWTDAALLLASAALLGCVVQMTVGAGTSAARIECSEGRGASEAVGHSGGLGLAFLSAVLEKLSGGVPRR